MTTWEYAEDMAATVVADDVEEEGVEAEVDGDIVVVGVEEEEEEV